jgi:hypothetical protein
MKAGLTAVSQATHSARLPLLANLPNALAMAPPTIQILGTLVPGNSRDRTFGGHALSSDLKKASSNVLRRPNWMPHVSKVAGEMALSILAYNLTRVMNTVGIKPLISAIGA